MAAAAETAQRSASGEVDEEKGSRLVAPHRDFVVEPIVPVEPEAS